MGIILLAAGASNRLGRPKQLLSFDGKTLLQHSLEMASGTQITPIITVLGANADTIKKEIAGNHISIIINTNWAEGMASSINCGLQKLIEIAPEANAVIIMVCDQPFVTVSLLEQLVAKYRQTGKPIIASHYQDTTGTPVLFDKNIFKALLSLKGDSGAKSILNQLKDQVDVVDFPSGHIDIDTETEYAALLTADPSFKDNP